MAEYTIPKPYRDFYVTNPAVEVENKVSTIESNISSLESDISNLESGKTKRVNLYKTLQTSDYRRSVIGLCKTSPANSNINSFSNGLLTFHRYNSYNPMVAMFVTIESKHTAEYGIFSSILCTHKINSSSHSVKPCTFLYNGVRYGGIDLYLNITSHGEIEFNGVSNFGIFGLDYYDVKNDTVLNEEVYNSLAYEPVDTDIGLYYNDLSLQTQPATGTAAPTITPTFIGQEYIDTTNQKVYKAIGNSSASDWIALN